MNDTIQWGIIGCGNVTEKKSGPAFRKAADSNLIAVMRRNRDQAEDYAKRHGVSRFFGDAGELIADPDVNAVYIATPPDAHCELALAVAAAGKPCYVEKPMARTLAECERMQTAFDNAALPLFVAYYRRALPHFQRMKALIDKATWGPLLKVHYTFRSNAMNSNPVGWRFDPEVSGGGLLWDLGSHALDLFDFWLGPLQQVTGQRVVDSVGVEHLATVKARSPNGTDLEATWDFASADRSDRVELVFEQARAELSVFGSANLQFTSADGSSSTETFDLPENIQLPLIQNIVASLRGGAEPLSTGTTATRTNAVLEALSSVALSTLKHQCQV